MMADSKSKKLLDAFIETTNADIFEESDLVPDNPAGKSDEEIDSYVNKIYGAKQKVRSKLDRLKQYEEAGKKIEILSVEQKNITKRLKKVTMAIILIIVITVFMYAMYRLEVFDRFHSQMTGNVITYVKSPYVKDPLLLKASREAPTGINFTSYVGGYPDTGNNVF
jgi:hypothetical protein